METDVLFFSDKSVSFYSLAVDCLSIVCKFEAFGQTTVGDFMSADVVGEVDEVCSLCTYATAYGYSIVNQLMAMVYFLEAESIDDKSINVMEVFVFAIVHALHVCDIGESGVWLSENVPQYRHIAMHHLNRGYLESVSCWGHRNSASYLVDDT